MAAPTLKTERLILRDYCEDDFKKSVIDGFISDYKKGVTPSPCPLCNSVFKFDKLLKIAEREGITKIATGHYAAIQNLDDGLSYIRRWNATFKEQSYMLTNPDCLSQQFHKIFWQDHTGYRSQF